MVFAISAFSAKAIPALPVWRTVIQPDGSRLELKLVGDERLHYFVTRDNVPVLEYGKAYYYADGIGFGMVRSNTLAHDVSERTGSEATMAELASTRRIENLRPFTRIRQFAPLYSSASSYTSDRTLVGGRHKSLVILVDFPDCKFRSGHDRAFYEDMVNKAGYTNEYGAIGSIHDYFTDQSNGKLDLTFDVVGPVTTDYNASHYGGSSSANPDDEDTYEFAYEVIQKAHDYNPHLNWADYDWNGDGEVENLYIIYAGYGQATGGDATTIWPAASKFEYYNKQYGETYVLNFNGVKINTFAYGNEEYGGSSAYGADEPMGIGTMTHEFSHCLGFPDFYDTDYAGNYGMNTWSILASGSYAGPRNRGWVPVGYTAYEKWAVGWIDYKTFKDRNDSINGLKSTYNGGDAYIIENDKMPLASGDKAEYFILENRTKNRWDAYLPAQGLEVLHVNYVKSIWDYNLVNSANNANGNRLQNMTIVPADNSTKTSGYDANFNVVRGDVASDLFPYGENDSITSYSQPSLTFYNTQKDGTKVFRKGIYDIMWNAADSTVSFVFNPVKQQLVDRIDNVASSTSKHVCVYTVDGKLVGRYTDFSGMSLPKGMYIIQDSNGNTRKIVVNGKN